jgi:hypothetical protein
MADLDRLLHRVSWQVEKLFKARGWLRTMVWFTEAKDGRRQMFETACEVERAEITHAQALAALCRRRCHTVRRSIPRECNHPAVAVRFHLDVERREHDSLCSASRR